MSYCRWSDKSDVYCYANVNGCWTVHLAGRRRIPGAPENPYKLGTNTDEHIKWEEEHGAELWVPVPAYDGQTDWDLGEPEECRDFLITLKEAGYMVPQYAIDRLNQELQDDA